MLFIVPAPSSTTKMAARSAGGIPFLFALSVLSATATTQNRFDTTLKPVLAETGFGVNTCFGLLGGSSSSPSARESSDQSRIASSASWAALLAPLRAASNGAAGFLALWAEISFEPGGVSIDSPDPWGDNGTIFGPEFDNISVAWSPSWAAVAPDLALIPLRQWVGREGEDRIGESEETPIVFLSSGVLYSLFSIGYGVQLPVSGRFSSLLPFRRHRRSTPWLVQAASGSLALIMWLSAPSSAAAVGVGVVVLALLLLSRAFPLSVVTRRPTCSEFRPPSPASVASDGVAGLTRWARDQPLADQRWASAAASEIISSSPRSELDGATAPVPDGQPLAGRQASERGQKRTRKGGVARPCANPGCSEPARFRCARCRHRAYCSAECQREDWPAHRPYCTSRASSPIRSLAHVLTLFSLADRGKAACVPGGESSLPVAADFSVALAHVWAVVTVTAMVISLVLSVMAISLLWPPAFGPRTPPPQRVTAGGGSPGGVARRPSGRENGSRSRSRTRRRLALDAGLVKRETSHFEVRQSQQGQAGDGLFSRTWFACGTPMLQFGRQHTFGSRAQCDAHLRRHGLTQEYSVKLPKGYAVDLTIKSTADRFNALWYMMNHAPVGVGAGSANMECRFDQQNNVCFFAIRDIHPGDELCWSYGAAPAEWNRPRRLPAVRARRQVMPLDAFRLGTFSPVSLLLAFLPVAGAVCTTCFDQIPNCEGGAACAFLTAVTANALVMTGGDGAPAELSCVHLLPRRVQRIFNRTTLNALQMMARRPAPGTPVNLAEATLDALIGLANNGGASPTDILREVNSRLPGANATEIQRLTAISANLRALETVAAAPGTTATTQTMLGVFTLVLAKALAVVRADSVTTSVVGVAVDPQEGENRTSTAGLSARLIAPPNLAACTDALHVFQDVCHATGHAHVLVTSPFLRVVFFDTINVRREPWQVAYCLLLVYLEKVETSSSPTVNLANVYEQGGGQDTLLAQAKERARSDFGASIFRSNLEAVSGGGGGGGGGGSSGGGDGAKTWNGSFNRDRNAPPCITFNLGRRQHPAACLNERGGCKFAHTCDAWVSDKGPKGVCGSSQHHRLTCDNPAKVSKPV